jgi:hypothetical protein
MQHMTSLVLDRECRRHGLTTLTETPGWGYSARLEPMLSTSVHKVRKRYT